MASVKKVSDNVVSLSGEVAPNDLVLVREELEGQIYLNRQGELTVSLDELRSADSVSLSLLICLMRAAEEHKCNLSFKNMPKAVFDMARVGGVEAVLPIAW